MGNTISRRTVEQVPTCSCKNICDKGDITPHLITPDVCNAVGDHCENCSKLEWSIVRTLPARVETIERTAYFAVVACPNPQCGSYQGVSLQRDVKNFFTKDEQACSVCGEFFHVMGDLMTVEVQSFTSLLRDSVGGRQ